MEDKLDKIYDLIGTMYSDLSKKIDSLGNEVAEIKQMQKKMDTKVEHKIEPKIQALFESKDIIYDKLDKIEEKIDNLASKVEKQEVEIKVIKGGR